MKFIAKQFLAACQAGLILAGQNEFGFPEWIGKDEEWEECHRLLNNSQDDAV